MFRQLSAIPPSLLLMLCIALALFSSSSSAQEQVLRDRWVEVRSDNFHIYSQKSSRQTSRFASELEIWRQVASFTISGVNSLPKASIPNLVYLFNDVETLQTFVATDDPAFFSATPRANFLAFAFDEEGSTTLGLHHYVHFLVRNFNDLSLPRWYEEALAGYLARVQVDGDDVELERFSRAGSEVLANVSELFSMDRLLYSDAALASPRAIQFANLKSSALLHYLLHAYEGEGFADRREELQSYLEYLLEGRNPRYAYDRSFEVTTEQLDEELHNYLLASSRSAGTVQVDVLIEVQIQGGGSIEGAPLASALAELALNSGNAGVAQAMFELAVEQDAGFARGLSGVGDALRMSEIEGMDQRIARYFIEAAELAPQDPTILLDYGEYWESELENCEKVWPSSERQQITADVYESFNRALEIRPHSAEANLAMGEYYLLLGNEWEQGVVYQQRAFELLPADTFILEQAVRYAISADQFEEAERLIVELAQPIHFFGEPGWVMALRERLLRKRRGEPYDVCE
ncbi:MAG: tetratricopeptide (TPR) repeat protein [Cyclobacteriaceae bacterium]|jgi:tetratricopeptide (TPR) repeat protein